MSRLRRGEPPHERTPEERERDRLERERRRARRGGDPLPDPFAGEHSASSDEAAPAELALPGEFGPEELAVEPGLVAAPAAETAPPASAPEPEPAPVPAREPASEPPLAAAAPATWVRADELHACTTQMHAPRLRPVSARAERRLC